MRFVPSGLLMVFDLKMGREVAVVDEGLEGGFLVVKEGGIAMGLRAVEGMPVFFDAIRVFGVAILVGRHDFI